MTQETINDVMLHDHHKIENLIIDFAYDLNEDLKKANVTFEKLKWELEKHFFVEEKAILTSIHQMDEGDSVKEFNALEEHEKLLKMLKDMENDLKDNIIPDFRRFKGILIRHKNFEDNIFYPYLEKVLDSNTKKEIIKKIKKLVTMLYTKN